ncbi:MAG: hypothetical protein ACREA7_04745 [Nitrosotalea sp.]
MDGNLRRFLTDTCSEILHGDYKQRVQEFAKMAKDDQDKAVGIVMIHKGGFWSTPHLTRQIHSTSTRQPFQTR